MGIIDGLRGFCEIFFKFSMDDMIFGRTRRVSALKFTLKLYWEKICGYFTIKGSFGSCTSTREANSRHL